MSEQKFSLRGRTLLAGKIISNFGQSTIDCVVRRISDHGATIMTESALGISKHFHLLIPGEGAPRPCKLVWQSGKELGLDFESVDAPRDDVPEQSERRAESIVSGQMLALRSALDEIETGVVLLDSDMHAQFINRAFRKIGLNGCSSHSGRRTFITRAARLVHRVGGSLRDVQLLAGHRSIQTTQRYIDGDTDAQRKLVSMI